MITDGLFGTHELCLTPQTNDEWDVFMKHLEDLQRNCKGMKKVEESAQVIPYGVESYKEEGYGL